MKYALIALALVASFLTVSHGLTASERSECLEWQAQEKEIAKWYSVEWQRSQCSQFQITFTK